MASYGSNLLARKAGQIAAPPAKRMAIANAIEICESTTGIDGQRKAIFKLEDRASWNMARPMLAPTTPIIPPRNARRTVSEKNNLKM